MSANPTHNSLLNRIGGWFKRTGPVNAEVIDPANPNAIQPARGGLFRFGPSRRDQAMASMQQGFSALTDLMTGIREGLDRSNERSEQLMHNVAALTEIARSMPEHGRMHTEALKAIHQQLAYQHEQQSKLADVLGAITQQGVANREMLDEMHERIEVMRETDAQIASNLGMVGTAMEQVSKTSSVSAAVLEQMRDGAHARDRDLERVLHRQGQRFTLMLGVAIFLSVAALFTVLIFGYLLLARDKPASPNATPPAAVR
jgi:DNA repair ATPase RecN